MKNILRKSIFFFLLAAPYSFAVGHATIKHHHLTIANGVVSKVFIISSKSPGPIIIGSLSDQMDNRELLANSSQAPWFEFVINHELVTSNDPLWKYIDSSQRIMRNLGTEYTLNFIGASNPVKGLRVSIKEQLFPGSSLIREQLILHVKGSAVFKLNKNKNKLQFIFPRYIFNDDDLSAKSIEIRIATWDGELLGPPNNSSFDYRRLYKQYGGDHNLSQAHMFHPKIIRRSLRSGSSLSFKGPLGLISNGNYSFLTAYEHASQDNVDSQDKIEHSDFLQIDQEVGHGVMSSAVKIVYGGYLDGEKITPSRPYKSVWTASGFYRNQELGQPAKLLHNYLLKWITEFPQTRETRFCYNTWAMQQDERAKGKTAVNAINYERLFKEIREAHQRGVQTFVLDAGWEENTGLWTPSHRLNRGLAPIYDTLKKYNMRLGLWMAPLLIDPKTKRYKEHPGWVIKDKDGVPVKLGNAGVLDFVSGFSDSIIDDCKRLIDQGVRYFKWDAIGTYYSFATGGFHGSAKDPQEDIIARYQYLLPLYIRRAMVALMLYNPTVVVEIDVTEERRSLMGLSTISAGKLFFMNNGASDYGDYSQFRAKSMRTIANEYNGILPLQVFTYYNYPVNTYPYRSQRYNINSSIICGRGLWGNLNLMSSGQRSRAGRLVSNAKLVSPFLKTAQTTIVGKVGASPEIYTEVNVPDAAGQVIGFSGSAMNYTHRVILNDRKFLGVIGNGFALKGDTLDLYFQFPMPDASREAFILPNQSTDIKILSCTSWLDSLYLYKNRLSLVCGAPGEIVVEWPKSIGYPEITGGNEKAIIHPEGKYYLVKMEILEPDTRILIK